MTPLIQNIAVYIIVAMAVSYLVYTFYPKRQNKSCGSDCGCASTELPKAK